MICTKPSFYARLASGALSATLLALLAGCGLGLGITTPTPGSSLSTATPGPGKAVQQTVIHFCQAMSDGNLDQAYALVSAHYKQTVTSSAQLPNQMPNFGKIAGCMEFGDGGFIQMSGDHATDSVQYMMTGGPFGNTTIPGHLGLAQSGAAWQIDSIGS